MSFRQTSSFVPFGPSSVTCRGVRALRQISFLLVKNVTLCLWARKRRGRPRCFGGSGEERLRGRSQGSEVVGCAFRWRVMRCADGRRVEMERSMRTGDARA